MSNRRGGRGLAFVAGTRSSRLALWQTEHVLALLRRTWPEADWRRREYSTRGDEDRDAPLADIGGRGAFTEKLEASLLAGEIDFAVHSLKDLPVDSNQGLTVAAVIGPRNAGEVLVSRDGRRLRDLPPAAVVGTSSLRRQAQLLRVRPDVTVRPIRGNVETRIDKVMRGEYDAALLAAAGVERLGLQDRIAERLDVETMLPAPGQGAIAVECRADDGELIERLEAITDRELDACTRAERSFLRALGGGCSAPVAALAEVESSAHSADGSGDRAGGGRVYRLSCRIVTPSGSAAVEVEGRGGEPTELGKRLAGRALLKGAGDILEGTGASPPPLEQVLAGRRVAVTRPRRQSEELSRALERVGAVVLQAPVIRIAELPRSESSDELLGDLEHFRWIVLASTNAVEHFYAALAGRGAFPQRLGERIAVVGPTTASAAAANGWSPGYVARGQTGAKLGAELPDVAGNELLVPCAEHATDELPRTLRERGATVTMLPLYRTEPIPLESDAVEELEAGVDYLLFTSGSTVTAFVDSYRTLRGEEELRSLLARTRVGCIGPSTARALEEIGSEPPITAEEHTAIGLVEAIIEYEREVEDGPIT